MRISAGWRNRMCEVTSLYSVILFFSALPRDGVISKVPLKSRTELKFLAMMATRVALSAIAKGCAAFFPRREMRRRTEQEENPSAIRQNASIAAVARLRRSEERRVGKKKKCTQA